MFSSIGYCKAIQRGKYVVINIYNREREREKGEDGGRMEKRKKKGGRRREVRSKKISNKLTLPLKKLENKIK